MYCFLSCYYCHFPLSSCHQVTIYILRDSILTYKFFSTATYFLPALRAPRWSEQRSSLFLGHFLLASSVLYTYVSHTTFLSYSKLGWFAMCHALETARLVGIYKLKLLNTHATTDTPIQKSLQYCMHISIPLSYHFIICILFITHHTCYLSKSRHQREKNCERLCTVDIFLFAARHNWACNMIIDLRVCVHYEWASFYWICFGIPYLLTVSRLRKIAREMQQKSP